jgi:hypothetical protein
MVAALSLPLLGCGADTGSSSSGSQVAASRADSAAQVACRHWRNVSRDAAAGILTEDELREKLKEVNSSAWVSEEPGVAEHAEGLLAAVTQRDSDAVSQHADGLSQACIDSGAFN